MGSVYLISIVTYATEKEKKSIEKERKKWVNCSILFEVDPELRPSKGGLIESQMASTPKH